MTMRYENPFPGMDPYLEHPHIWPGFHNRLITHMADDLAGRLPSNYRIDIQERTEIATVHDSDTSPPYVIPDALLMEASAALGRREAGVTTVAVPPENGVAVRVAMPEEVRVAWLYVQRMPDWKVVTVVEVLSPTNKIRGEGRENYLRKRAEFLNSRVSLVEIDLLRRWEPMPLETVAPLSHYRILVCRGWQRPNAVLYPFSVEQDIPKFTLPLQPGDDEPEVDLGALVSETHRRGRYGQIAGYANRPPAPAFAAEVQTWVDSRLEAFRPPD